MASDEITRVRYFERQFLGAVDFLAEQTYDRDARRRHVLAHHTWGIVAGLLLEEVAVAGQNDVVDVVVHAGLAVDGFGRELVAYHPIRLDPAGFDAFHTDAHQSVWIAYAEDQSGLPRSGFADCQYGEANRTVEGWRIVVSPMPPTHDDVIVDGVPASVPPAPAGTPEIPADESVPYQELPGVPPGDRWLVRLGTVRWDGGAQVFRPAAPGRLNEERRYVGVVAEHLLTPQATLSVRPRRAPADVDAADFVTVEGRVRVEGRVNAEKEVWVEGGRIRFTYAAGDEENTPITLGRERPPGNAPGHRLRLRLGNPADPTTALSVGPGDAGNGEDVVRVRADQVVEIPAGIVTFGQKTRQMIDLWSTAGDHQYGIGVQAGTLYQRSDSDFCWFKGGGHDDGAANPGAGGQLQLRLDGNANLLFGTRTRQMLNLWGTEYGVGVQAFTLYFRSHNDFAWFRNGGHSDGRGDPGGGVAAMTLDDQSHLHVAGRVSTGGDVTVGAGGDAKVVTRHVFGKGSGNDAVDNLYLNWNNGRDVVVGVPNGLAGNLVVSGDLRVFGHAPSVIKAKRYERVVQNAGQDAPANWVVAVSADFTEVYEAFVVLNGFSLFANNSTTFASYGHVVSTGAIPQHAYVRVTSVSNTQVTGLAYCAESDRALETDNSILFTVVVLGRVAP